MIRYKNGSAKRFTRLDGLPDNSVTDLLLTKDGRFWIGTIGGIAFYENGEFTSFTEADGLASNYTRSFYEDSDGILWIGSYDGGLSRFKDGKFARFTVEDGMFSNNVFCILEDDNGWFWMNSNQGIYRVRRQHINDFADGKIKRLGSIAYTKNDGLLNSEGNGGRQPSGIRRSNGELWFPTIQGIAVINPKNVASNPKPPPVFLEEISIDRREIEHYGNEIEIQPGQTNLEINYTGLSFVNSPLVKFHYRLEGLDENWSEVGSRRTAFYNKLPPGEYTFRVSAANRDGVWNTEGAAIKIIVHPYFYQTWWFSGLAGLTIAGILGLLYRYRVAQLEKINAARMKFAGQLIESQERERKRIAAELHDGLGQSLVIIKNRAVFGTEDENLEHYDEISETASDALGEVREIIYNLRPHHLDRIGLTKTIKAMLKRASGVIKFDADIDPIDDVFPKNAEITVYRIVQECVNNILKHSAATEAQITIRRDENAVRIRVKDNGKGFDTNIAKIESGGFGLFGLSERTRLIGSRFEIESANGKGTKIIIHLPIGK